MFTEDTRFVAYAVLPVGQPADVGYRAAVTRTEALSHTAALRRRHTARDVAVVVVDAATLDEGAALARWECHGQTWTQTRSWPATGDASATEVRA